MRESTQAKSQRILEAMLQGKKITPVEANRIGDTTDGTRHIRFIREKYPVKSEKVEGRRRTLPPLLDRRGIPRSA